MASSGGALFLSAVRKRVDETLDACTRCGKCVVACPDGRAGRARTPRNAAAIVEGSLDLLAGGPGTPDAERWAPSAPTAASAFRPASTASIRASWSTWRAWRRRPSWAATTVRRGAHQYFSAMNRSTRVISRLLLTPEVLGAVQPAVARRRRIRRGPGHRLLHRLQHHQDAAHRAARARGARPAWRHLRGDGRRRDLLRHTAVQAGRRQDRRPGGLQHHRAARAPGRVPRHLVVPELPDPDRRIRAAGLRRNRSARRRST